MGDKTHTHTHTHTHVHTCVNTTCAPTPSKQSNNSSKIVHCGSIINLFIEKTSECLLCANGLRIEVWMKRVWFMELKAGGGAVLLTAVPGAPRLQKKAWRRMLWDSRCRGDAGTGEGGSASQHQGLHLIAVERLRTRVGTGEDEGERRSGEGSLWRPGLWAPGRQEGETPEGGEECCSLKWGREGGAWTLQ